MSKTQTAVLWLSLVENLPPRKKRAILDLCEPEQLWDNFEQLQRHITAIIGDNMTGRLVAARDNVEREADRLASLGITLVTCFDDCYPLALKEIAEPPVHLFVLGETSALSARSVAVVGSRTPSRYAVKVAEQFSREFARAGLCVVSGLARGIDSVAHRTTLDADGTTVAVIGSGLNVIYPSENRQLVKNVCSAGGAVVSEYPLDTKPLQYHFPERNRIVAGLSEGVFLPEAGEKSGALQTVNIAIDQGKHVFVTPSMINSVQSLGSNKLLRDIPHALVIEPEDVLSVLHISSTSEKKEPIQLSFAQQQVLRLLEAEGELHFESLLEGSSLEYTELNLALLELEMAGIVDKLPGNYFALA